MSGSNCCFLTCIQMSQEAGQVAWYSHFLKNFAVCCDPHSHSFSVVNEADVFLVFPCFIFISVFLPCWLFGLRHSSTGAYSLWVGARSWPGQMIASRTVHVIWVLPSTSATSVLAHTMSHSCLLLPQETLQDQHVGLVQAAMQSLFFSLKVLVFTRPCVHPLRAESLFSPVLWSSRDQVPLAFKVRCSEGSFSQCQSPRLGNLMCVAPDFHSCGRTSVI